MTVMWDKMAAKKDDLIKYFRLGISTNIELRSETVAHISLLGVATFKPTSIS